ncbi:sugar transferase [Fulvimarina sp. MAC3]|uniref:sugar transferase n=1 Tax=Fulvimarina sp. MAC3 TaxID=3148887 RepID=UPI0031FE3343
MSDLSNPTPFLNGRFQDRRTGRKPGLFRDRRKGDRRKAAHWWKRPIDITVAIVAIVFFAPVFLLIALALLISDGRPVFYRHKRLGKGGQSFDCLKFRTMRCDSDAILVRLLAEQPAIAEEWATTRKLSNDPRIHRVGNILRRSNLDELPQLINVIKGEMSLVGPRPIVEAEVDLYGEGFFAYQAVRPGITGLWQVSGRNTLTYETRVDLDASYVKQLSLSNDLIILIKTVPIVLLAKGDYSK